MNRKVNRGVEFIGRYKVALHVLCWVAVGCSPAIWAAGQPGFRLEVEISGMVGLIPEGEMPHAGARLVAVNETASPHAAGHLRHHPYLVVPCENLTVPSQREDCEKGRNGWSTSSLGEMGFDLSAGFDIRVLDSSGEIADELVYSQVLTDYVVDLGRIGATVAASAPELSKKATTKLLDRVVFRVAMRSGDLGVGWVEPRRDWAFVAPGGVVRDRRERLAGSLLWRVSIWEDSVKLLLQPYGNKPPVTLTLAPRSGRRLRVVLRNEPTTADFCQHEPTPNNPFVLHFAGFYRLAERPEIAEMALPRYDGHVIGCGPGAKTYRGNWPRICTIVQFDEQKQEW